MTTDRPIKLAARLPKGSANGLDTIYDQVSHHGTAYVIMKVVAQEVVLHPGDEREPKLTIVGIEGLPDAPDADHVSTGKRGGQLLAYAYRRRTSRGEPDLFDGGVLADADPEVEADAENEDDDQD